MNCPCCWEDYDAGFFQDFGGPVQIEGVPYLNRDGSGIRYYAWLDQPDTAMTGPDLRDLAAHLLEAADMLERLAPALDR
jgi:hypothetical protein